MTWIDLGDIMLSEVSHTLRKINIAWYHLYVGSRKGELIEIESRRVVIRGYRVGSWGTILY